MRRAARTDDNHADVVAALRAAGACVQSLAAIGKGCPDLLVWSAAKGYVLLEVKDGDKFPSHRKLTADQTKWLREWRGPVLVVTSSQAALRAIGAIA